MLWRSSKSARRRAPARRVVTRACEPRLVLTSPMSNLWLRRVVVPAIAALVFGFVWLLRFNDPNGSFAGLTDDHFFYLTRGWQILYGELPVRDFVDHGAPLYYYTAAAV